MGSNVSTAAFPMVLKDKTASVSIITALDHCFRSYVLPIPTSSMLATLAIGEKEIIGLLLTSCVAVISSLTHAITLCSIIFAIAALESRHAVQPGKTQIRS